MKIAMAENLYITQYPELMRGRTILYVHGFGSSAQSGTVKRISETFPSAKVIAYDLPIVPGEAMELLRKVCEAEQPDLVIGTSMGGMYAEMLYGIPRILVNPAFEMGDTMTAHNMTGKQVFMNKRADGVQEFIVTKALVKEYKAVTEQCFSQVTPAERDLVYGLFGDSDDVVHTFDLFLEHYPNAIHFHGGHRLDDRSFITGVVPVVRWVSDRLDGVSRNVVYISSSTLKDAVGCPKSSLNKSFDFLVAHYAVYVVAPSPTNGGEEMLELQRWVENYLGVAAWNRVIYTCRPDLLYGDYFIDDVAHEDFMGTTIRFGSEEFKTWEPILTFFERLDGQ